MTRLAKRMDKVMYEAKICKNLIALIFTLFGNLIEMFLSDLNIEMTMSRCNRGLISRPSVAIL